ncbi:MAG TPA: hypothetical protein VKP13_08550 [Nitrospira sp.]|nr:hypothetical protein [Nitrospira sp.]
MNRYSPLYHALVIGTFCLLSGVMTGPAQSAGNTTGKAAIPAATAPSNALAAGSVEDSLQACMARIPKDATAGQRMIAEQSCQRDEGDRKPFQASGSR